MAAPKKDEKDKDTVDAAKNPEAVAEAVDTRPKQEGKGGHPENNEIGPSGDTQAPPPPGNPESDVEPDDDSLSEDEQERAKEIADHPLAKFGEKVQKSAEEEAKAFEKAQEENN